MEALFFVSGRAAATGVRSEDDLPCEPLAPGLPVPGPEPLLALATALGVQTRGALSQLRDATCQSFPIWSLGPGLLRALLQLDDSQIDDTGQSWLEACGSARPDADLYEICLLLEALRAALREREDATHELFVLLEEKAL